MSELVSAWVEKIRHAAGSATPLSIEGGGSKRFLGRSVDADVLNVAGNVGIVSYEPTELVVTVRGGTPLAELEGVLAGQNQFLAFEPPHFGPRATVAGCIAAGLSGPRRATVGAVRDFVLGVKIIDGRGEIMSFGGQVMKNVAGYDVSRLVAGSLGTLGIILEVSLKVLPRPFAERTIRFSCSESEAIRRLNEWGGQPLPLSASAWADDTLTLRLSGAWAAVDAACVRLGGEAVDADVAAAFWVGLREQQSGFFNADDSLPLCRLAVPSVAPPLALGGEQLIEWGGAQRWLRTDAPLERIRTRAAELGGHATLFRGGDRSGDVFTPLDTAVLAIHRRMKAAFDPAGIFNPGRLYQGI